MRLYTFWRSSAAYRVRIALNLKAIRYESVAKLFSRDEHRAPEYLALNPQGLIPALEDAGFVIGQSLAIIEYLDETHREPPLLPAEPRGRAVVRSMAQGIACDIHPLNNLRVLRHLKSAANLDDAQRDEWARHWIRLGFDALETSLAGSALTGMFCHGDSPTLADCCLVPQIANAQRVQLPLDAWPTLRRIHERCLQLRAFADAAPAAQPDAE